MSKVRLSPSRVNDFNNCPQLYKYRAIDQLPEEISLDAERGTLVHSILHDLFDDLLLLGIDHPNCIISDRHFSHCHHPFKYRI